MITYGMCLRTGAKKCLRQGIKYMMLLLFVKVKNTLFMIKLLFFVFDICPVPWAGEQFFRCLALW